LFKCRRDSIFKKPLESVHEEEDFLDEKKTLRKLKRYCCMKFEYV
jgi:hypothetical protein